MAFAHGSEHTDDWLCEHGPRDSDRVRIADAGRFGTPCRAPSFNGSAIGILSSFGSLPVIAPSNRRANGEDVTTSDSHGEGAGVLVDCPQRRESCEQNELQEIPTQLSWDPAPGAGYYQVFIRDLWNEDRLIFSSKLLEEPVVQLPAGLLEKGGYYSWIVHARDLNEHFMLGDFNHGSLSPVVTFSIQP